MLFHHAVRAGLVVLSGLALHVTLPERAEACAGFACRPGALLPAHMGKLPANALELFWQPPVTFSAPSSGPSAPVHLYQVAGGARTELAIDIVADGGLFRVKPKNAVAAGTELSFESEAPVCVGAEERKTFQLTVTPAAAKPSRAGELRVAAMGSRSLSLWVSSGECTLPFPVQAAELAFTLDAEALPYADVLRHALIVDGVERSQYVPYPGHVDPQAPPNLGGRLDDLIFTVCGTSVRGTSNTSGEKEGTHKLQWLTRLQDGTELRSNELSVELRCPIAVDDGPARIPDASIASADSGAALEHDAGARADLAQQDAASPTERSADASAASAQSASASEPDGGDDAETRDGCSLRAASQDAGPRANTAWVYVALALLAGRRRRG